MGDKYDAAIAYLTENPDQILVAWCNPFTRKAGCLFNYVRPDRVCFRPGSEIPCGCLSQVASCIRPAWTDDLERRIRADDRIPRDEYAITVADLPVFAEWQRELDRTIRATEVIECP